MVVSADSPEIFSGDLLVVQTMAVVEAGQRAGSMPSPNRPMETPSPPSTQGALFALESGRMAASPPRSRMPALPDSGDGAAASASAPAAVHQAVPTPPSAKRGRSAIESGGTEPTGQQQTQLAVSSSSGAIEMAVRWQGAQWQGVQDPLAWARQRAMRGMIEWLEESVNQVEGHWKGRTSKCGCTPHGDNGNNNDND